MSRGKKVKIQYIGRRKNGNRIDHAYLHRGKIVFFSHTKWTPIGEWVEAFKNGEDMCKSKTPTYVEGPKPTDEQKLKWSTEDALAGQILKKRREAARIARRPEIFQSMSNLKAAYKKATFGQRHELLQALFNFLESETK